MAEPEKDCAQEDRMVSYLNYIFPLKSFLNFIGVGFEVHDQQYTGIPDSALTPGGAWRTISQQYVDLNQSWLVQGGALTPYFSPAHPQFLAENTCWFCSTFYKVQRQLGDLGISMTATTCPGHRQPPFP